VGKRSERSKGRSVSDEGDSNNNIHNKHNISYESTQLWDLEVRQAGESASGEGRHHVAGGRHAVAWCEVPNRYAVMSTAVASGLEYIGDTMGVGFASPL